MVVYGSARRLVGVAATMRTDMTPLLTIRYLFERCWLPPLLLRCAALRQRHVLLGSGLWFYNRSSLPFIHVTISLPVRVVLVLLLLPLTYAATYSIWFAYAFMLVRETRTGRYGQQLAG
jgi:hypothetical protein